MTRRGPEAKPRWRDVPPTVRAGTASLLGSPVIRAERAFGGYGPSATFRLRLADGRGAFFKGVYPLPEGSAIHWVLDREQRVFERLSELIRPWAPAYFGAVANAGWHGLLIEDLGPASVPPWTRAKARATMRAYAEFHARSLGCRLPRWLPGRRGWAGFGRAWQRLGDQPDGMAELASLAGERSKEARAWLDAHLPTLAETAEAFPRVPGPFALLHLDTRSDNIRVNPAATVPLRIFDWPLVMAGPPELDLVAFAQSIDCEGGPAPEQLTEWYAEVLPVRRRILVGAAVAVAGFFAGRAWQPPLDGLPRLRSIQRRQLRASLAWAARLLELPEPAWLADVPS